MPWEPIKAHEDTRVTIVPFGGSKYNREIFIDGASSLDWWRRQVGKSSNLRDVSSYSHDENGFLLIDLKKLEKIL